MSKYPNWTAEELTLLKEYYPKLGRCKELQDLFPSRGMEGICLKANRIGLKVIHNVKEGRTNKEYLVLIEKTSFIPLEEYKGSTVPIIHMCGVCDHTWKARPQQLLREGAKCPICSHKDRFTDTQIVDSVLNKANIKRHSEYLGAFEPLTVEHLSCGNIWTTKYSYIQQGSGCPSCNKGFGYLFQGINIPEKAYLYIFKILIGSVSFLKVGITCRNPKIREREIRSDVTKRYSNTMVEPLIVFESSGEKILYWEQYLLNNYPKFSTDKVFCGNTEIFNDKYLLEFVELLEKELNVQGF